VWGKVDTEDFDAPISRWGLLFEISYSAECGQMCRRIVDGKIVAGPAATLSRSTCNIIHIIFIHFNVLHPCSRPVESGTFYQEEIRKIYA